MIQYPVEPSQLHGKPTVESMALGAREPFAEFCSVKPRIGAAISEVKSGLRRPTKTKTS